MSTCTTERPKEAPPVAKSNEKYLLILVIGAAVLLYFKTFGYFWKEWMSEAQYSLAFLVPFVSGYFAWKSWPEVLRTKRTPTIAGLVMIVLAMFMHIAGNVLDISGPSSISVLLYLLGCCLYFHGKGLVKILWFPLAYLLFALPVPGGVTDLVGFPLQLWASAGTAKLLTMMGLEVYRTGVNLSVPGFEFQVAEACSGMSSLVALVGVTAVFAFITRLPNAYKWLLFFLAIPIALIANVIRIITIALVGYNWGSDAALKIYHDWSSPILFMVAIVVLYLISRGFEWLTERRATA